MYEILGVFNRFFEPRWGRLRSEGGRGEVSDYGSHERRGSETRLVSHSFGLVAGRIPLASFTSLIDLLLSTPQC